MNKKIKIILTYLIVLLILLIVGLFVRKLIIFNTISNKLLEYTKSTNYQITQYDYYGWYSLVSNTFVKDSNLLRTTDAPELPTTMVKKGNSYESYNGTTTNITDTAPANQLLDSNWDLFKVLSQNLKEFKNLFKYSLSSAFINGKECYKICENNSSMSIMYFDKETSLLVRYENLLGFCSAEENEIQSTLSDYRFQFNSVTDEDLKELNNL